MSDVEGPMSASEYDGGQSGNFSDEKSEGEMPEEEEVLQYANYIGIDMDKEPHLRWIAERGICAPVPLPWKECADGGENFYFNTVTNESIWEHPCDSKYKRLVKKYRALGPAAAPTPSQENSECSDSEGSIVGGSCSGSSRRSSPRSPRSPRANGGQASEVANIARNSRSNVSTPPSSARSPRSPRVDGSKASDPVSVGGSCSGSSRSPRSHRSGSHSPASPHSPRSSNAADSSKEPGAGGPVGLGGAPATQRFAGAGLVEDESFASDASGLLASQSAENYPGLASARTGDNIKSKSGSAEDLRCDDGHRNQSPSERSASSRKSSTGRGAGHGDRCLSPEPGRRSPSAGSSHEATSAKDEVKNTGRLDNFRRQASSRSRSPSSRSASPERQGSLSHGHDDRCLSPDPGRRSPSAGSFHDVDSAKDEGKSTGVMNNFRRQVSSRSRSPSSRSASPERQGSFSHGHDDRCLSPEPGRRSPSAGSSHDATSARHEGKNTGVVDNFRRRVSSRSRSPSSRSASPERRRSSSHGSRSLVESDNDIDEDIPQEPQSHDEAPVSPLGKAAPAEAAGAPVDVRGLEQTKPSSAARATLKTWGQLQTEVQALSEILEGVRAVRVKQQEYLQRLVSGPPSSTHGS